MVSFKNIFRRHAKGVPNEDIADSSSTRSAVPKSKKVRMPSTHWTKHQIFYVFIMNGIGAFVISGGINFAIAYGMYAHQDPVTDPIRLWRFPNTLSGDAAVTLFVQCVVTWLITMITVSGDLRNGKVQPIGFIPEPKNRLLRYYFFLDAEQPVGRRNFGQWIVFVLSQIGRSLVFSVPLFFLVWPATMGILTSSTIGAHRGSDYYYSDTWAPEVFKLLYGGIVGLLQNPFFVMMWLLTVGWREQRLQSLPISSSPPMTQHAFMSPATTSAPSQRLPATSAPVAFDNVVSSSVSAPRILSSHETSESVLAPPIVGTQ